MINSMKFFAKIFKEVLVQYYIKFRPAPRDKIKPGSYALRVKKVTADSEMKALEIVGKLIPEDSEIVAIGKRVAKV